MSKIKLIAVDLDGTLLDKDGKIPEENRCYLKKFSENGGIVVLSSGRMTDSVSTFADKLGIDCPLIVYNGAVVRLRKKEGRKTIFHREVPVSYSNYVIDYCLRNKFHLNFYLDDKLFTQRDPLLKKYSSLYSKQTGSKCIFLVNLAEMKGKKPTKLILITDSKNKDITRTRDYQYNVFKRKFKDKIKLVKTNPEYLEFINRNVDKGVGLKKIADYYGVKREEIVSFGDGENDIEMLLYSGISVVPSNAKEKVKKVAKIVSNYSNNQAFIGKFLKEFLPNLSDRIEK